MPPLEQIIPNEWFPLFFVGMWVTICILLSCLGGWLELSRMFGTNDSPEGETYRFRSGSVGRQFLPVSYGNCLTFTFGRNGFGLRILFLFRIFHQPLFIPWKAVESVTQEQALFLQRTIVRLRGSAVRIKIYGSAGAALSSAFSKRSRAAA